MMCSVCVRVLRHVFEIVSAWRSEQSSGVQVEGEGSSSRVTVQSTVLQAAARACRIVSSRLQPVVSMASAASMLTSSKVRELLFLIIFLPVYRWRYILLAD